MKTKIMICQPMKGKTLEEIKKEREPLIKTIEETTNGEYIDTVFDEIDFETPLFYLSESLKFMDTADVVWFMPGWEKARGCRIEFETAKEYGKIIKCLTQDEIDDWKPTKKSNGVFDDMDKLIEQFKTDLEEMLNDFTEKREG